MRPARRGRSSYLLLAFARLGLVPDGAAIALAAARAGGGRAAKMAMLGGDWPLQRGAGR
jgi:enoyl-CoA hydratase/carnithine racemase